AQATADLAPADRRMYAVRDVSGTVESIPLITSSILSKKLAEGIDGLVMDVKCGRAAFMVEERDARALMESIVATGRAAGLRMAALLTDMDLPLGRAIGNALEVAEVLDALEGRGPPDLLEVTLALGVEMLLLGGLAPDAAAARASLLGHLQDGSARACFERNLRAQGGDPAILTDRTRLGRATHVVAVRSPRNGFVTDVEPLALGLAVVELGGGRRQPTDPIDPTAGIVLKKTFGDPVLRDEILAEVHASDAEKALDVAVAVEQAMPIGPERRVRGPLVRARLA
ncbi:MAG TPA: thymidine phosphorylase, partial [Acetobacteraceae bacterium]|nr:thymidine phosphorylase [Acetobacteraceae bacterium]